MAKEIVLNFRVNAEGEPIQKVIKNTNELKNATKELQKQLDGLDFGTEEYIATAKAIDQLNGEYEMLTKTTKDVDDSFLSLNKQIKSTKSELDKFKIGTKEYDNASIRLKALQERLGDVTDAAKIQGSGFEKVSGSFNLFKESIGTADLGKAKIAFNAIGSAMKAIPIFLLIEGIKFLIEKFDVLKGSGGLLGKVFTAIGDAITWVMDKIEEFSNWIGLTNTEIEKQNKKQLELAATSKKAAAERSAQYDRQIAEAKASGKNTVEMEKAKQDAIIATSKTILDQTMAQIKLNASNGIAITQEQRDLMNQQIEDIKAAASAKRIIENTEHKTKLEKLKSDGKEYAKNRADIDKQLIQLATDHIANVQEKETIALKNKFELLKKELIQKGANKKDLEKLKEEELIALQNLEVKYAKETKLAVKKAEEEASAITIAAEADLQKQLYKIRVDSRKLYIENEKLGIELNERELERRKVNGEAIGTLDEAILARKHQLYEKEKSLALIQLAEEEKDQLKAADAKINKLQIDADKERQIKEDLQKELQKLTIGTAEYKNKEALLEAQTTKHLATEEAKFLALQEKDAIETYQRTANKKLAINQKMLDDANKATQEFKKEETSFLRQSGESWKDWADRITPALNKALSKVTAVFNQISSVVMGVWSSIAAAKEFDRAVKLDQLEKDHEAEIDSIRSAEEDKLAVIEEYANKQTAALKKEHDTQLANYDAFNTSWIETQRALGYDTTAFEAQIGEERAAMQLAQQNQEAQQKANFENQKAQIKYEADMAAYAADLEMFNQQEKLKEQAFKADKNMKIAQIVISTITGAIAAFTGMAAAIPGPYGLIAGAIAAAAVTAMGAIAAAQVSSTHYIKGSAPKEPKPPKPQTIGAGAGGGGAEGAYKPPSLKDTTLYGTGGGATGNQAQSKQQVEITGPVRAYVLAGDIQTELEAEAALKRKVTGF
jgi:hypothetical protein